MVTEEANEIQLGADFKEIVVRAQGARVAFHADGSIDCFTNDVVRLHPLGDDAGKNAGTAKSIKPGDAMSDGTIYAGVSPDTGYAMYVTPKDAPRAKFNEAARYASELDAHDHHDWRLPTRNEMKEIYKNRHAGKLNGTFRESSGSGRARWYWSCTEDREGPSGVYLVDFTDGDDGWNRKDGHSLSSRPLRAEPRP